MKKVVSYLKKMAMFLGVIFIFALMLSLFNLIGLSKSISSIILFILQILLFFGFGFINGKKTDKKGFIEGLKTALILVVIMFLLSIILYNYSFRISNLVYYLTLGLSSIFGAIIGKNKK